MVIVIFRSRLAQDAAAGYPEMAAEMVSTAREMPGFVDVKSFKADDGERLTLVWWRDQETMRAWRDHPRHRIAQKLGRDEWYESYNLEVAEIIRQSSFNRKG